jgi:glutamine amidotransferase
MKIAVVDYGMGNLRSVAKALERLAPQAEVRVSAAPEAIRAAERVVVPGQGALPDCMRSLAASGALEAVLEAARAKPFLGICVGMQMLFDRSEEDRAARGLGIIAGTVRWIPAGVKRPQMQWNVLDVRHLDDPMLAGLGPRPWVYFVHSLHGVPADPDVVAATCDYGGPLNAAFRSGNVFATQFHPEKSGRSGLVLLDNFVRIAAGVRS